MPEKIDGHLQYTGNGYQFFETKQPGLTCYDPECKECRRLSEERWKAADDKERQRLAREEEARQLRIEQDAQQRILDEQRNEELSAARMKGDAIRMATLQKKDDLQKLADNTAKKLEDLGTKYEADKTELLAREKVEFDKISSACDKRLVEINETDWLAASKAKKAA